MIKLKQKQDILLMYLREGKSQREISKITGKDRKTIGKYIREYEGKREELEQSGQFIELGELIEEMVGAPKYKAGVRTKRKLTEEIELKIIGYLEENKEKRLKGMRKQVKKPVDIHEAPTSITDELIKLAELKKQGILTEEEFNIQKQKLLS